MKNTRNIIIGLLVIGALAYFFKCNICAFLNNHHGICSSCNDHTHAHWHIKPIKIINGHYYVEFNSINSNGKDNGFIGLPDSTFLNINADNIIREKIGNRGDTAIWKLNFHSGF